MASQSPAGFERWDSLRALLGLLASTKNQTPVHDIHLGFGRLLQQYGLLHQLQE